MVCFFLSLFLSSTTAVKPSFEARYQTWAQLLGEGERKRGRGLIVKQKAGKQLKEFAHLPLPISPSAHITAWRSRVPMCKRRTEHKSEDGLCLYASHLPWGKKKRKKEKKHFSDGSQAQLPEPKSSRVRAGDLVFPFSPPSFRSPGSAAAEVPPAAPPPVTSGGRSLGAAGCWAPAVGHSCPSAQRRSPSGPEPFKFHLWLPHSSTDCLHLAVWFVLVLLKFCLTVHLFTKTWNTWQLFFGV